MNEIDIISSLIDVTILLNVIFKIHAHPTCRRRSKDPNGMTLRSTHSIQQNSAFSLKENEIK